MSEGIQHSMPFPHAQRGVALLTVLLMLFVASLAVMALVTRQQRGIQALSHTLDQTQAYEYALGAEEYALAILADDARQGQALDHPGEIWAGLRTPFAIAEGEVVLRIEDAQGKFNINSLLTENEEATAASRFAGLLKALELPPELLAEAQDWLDADILKRQDGAEDAEYAGERPAYRAANSSMSSPSELLLLKHMTHADYLKLTPWVTALPPEAFEINLNTAQPWLLAALLGEEERTALAARKGGKGFISPQEFKGVGFIAHGYSTQSDYFTVYVQVRYRQALFSLTSLVGRRAGAEPPIRVVSRDFAPRLGGGE